MREARPDQVWAWTSPEHVAAHLDRIAPALGRRRDFWLWLFAGWIRDMEGVWLSGGSALAGSHLHHRVA